VNTTHNDIRVSHSGDGTLLIHFGGSWKLSANLPSASEIQHQVEAASPPVRRVAFETSGITDWDTGLLTFVAAMKDYCTDRGIATDTGGLPGGAQKLLALATAVPEAKGARRSDAKVPMLDQVGLAGMKFADTGMRFLDFLGSYLTAFARFLQGKARFRRQDFTLVVQQVGANALPIVTVINFLVGAILAYVGALQLKPFGAQIYVANLVAVAMAREMASLMTGIILSGRTGASFAANLGTMRVNEEIDALDTMGINPMEFLVLPRVLALALMTPLLCIYADLIGILGGMTVSAFVLDIGVREYISQTELALEINHLLAGLIKGGAYGVLVGLAGCFRGMQSGRSASAVGDAATAAAVTGIVSIIVADLFFTVIFDAIGI
jgi:phospholipid/cholesterol/gamma-HCH transport system permease protein